MIIGQGFDNRIGIKLKTLFNKSINNIDGMYVVQEAIMKNHIKGTVTVLKSFDVEVGLVISDNLVGVQGLQRK